MPAELAEEYRRIYGEAPSAAVRRFLKRELMQKIWVLLLDDAFLDAWRTGIVILCGDGIRRRVFPRVFTYSADYPEKCAPSMSLTYRAHRALGAL